MARRNVSLPDGLDQAAREAGLNVSALAQAAIEHELDRRRRMARLDEWLEEMDLAHGRPSAEAVAAAEAWLDSAVPADRRVSDAGPGEHTPEGVQAVAVVLADGRVAKTKAPNLASGVVQVSPGGRSAKPGVSDAAR